MTKEKMIQNLDKKIQKVSKKILAIDYAIYMVSKEQQNAEEMTRIENQKFHDEWVCEEERLTNYVRSLIDIKNDLMNTQIRLCEKLDELYR